MVEQLCWEPSVQLGSTHCNVKGHSKFAEKSIVSDLMASMMLSKLKDIFVRMQEKLSLIGISKLRGFPVLSYQPLKRVRRQTSCGNSAEEMAFCMKDPTEKRPHKVFYLQHLNLLS